MSAKDHRGEVVVLAYGASRAAARGRFAKRTAGNRSRLRVTSAAEGVMHSRVSRAQRAPAVHGLQRPAPTPLPTAASAQDAWVEAARTRTDIDSAATHVKRAERPSSYSPTTPLRPMQKGYGPPVAAPSPARFGWSRRVRLARRASSRSPRDHRERSAGSLRRQHSP